MTALPGAILKRAAAALLTLVALSMLLFLFVEVLPGDAAERNLGPYATDEQLVAARDRLGLDEPLAGRYVSWVGDLVQGDLGASLSTGTPVGEIVGNRLPNTALLASIALVTIAGLSLVIGLVTGTRPGGRLDTIVTAGGSFALALPEFVTATVLVTIFAWQLDLLPPVVVVRPGGSVLDRPSMLVLPVLSVVVLGVSAVSRLVRAVVIEVGQRPNIEAARLQGIPERTVLRRHLLPAVIGPAAQLLAFTVPYLVGGTLVVEFIFNYPGLSSVLLDGVSTRDAPVVEGLGMVFGVLVVGALFVADVVEIAADPRMRARAVST